MPKQKADQKLSRFCLIFIGSYSGEIPLRCGGSGAWGVFSIWTCQADMSGLQATADSGEAVGWRAGL